MKLFELFATLSLDASEFNDGVDDAADAADELGEQIGHSLANGINKMGAAISSGVKQGAAALWSFGVEAAQVAADVQAENEQYAATFAGVEEAAATAFAGVAEQTGIFAARLRGVGMQAFSQFKGAGMDSALAMDTMARHMNIAADAAAYYNISFEDADARLRSFLRGNTEAGDAIGLFTSEMQRNDKALAMYNMKWQDLNEQQRQLVMLDIADEIYRSSGAFGQAGREAASYSNVIANFESKWRQTVAKLGEPLLRNVLPVMDKISKWFEDNPELVSKLAEGIGVVADKLGSMLLDLFEYVANHSDEIVAFLDGVVGFVSFIFDTLAGKNAENTVKDNTPGLVLTPEEIDKWNAFVDLHDKYVRARNNHDEGIVSNEDFAKIQAEYDAAYNSFTEREWLLINKYQDYKKKGSPYSFGYHKIDPDIYAGGYYTMEDGTTVLVDAELAPGAEGDVQGELNGHNYTVPVTPTLNLGGIVSGFTGWLGTLGAPHATGLDYVPYNDYAARLHEGEAVLTKAEAEAWRRGGTPVAGIDYGLMADAMMAAFAGVSLQMDSQVVGGLVSPTVSRRIARETRKRRFTTV